MWYFAWILGVLLACTLGVINVMWYEFQQHKDSIADDELELHERLKRHNDN
ncbi:cytochrome bd-I oxidase subunit CydX [Pseudoalteromonas shioyasakiensis]|uniref:cytochrome bd-I oxidase subunit CydX n=1 Tax=Pseudoalteromonas shioyasakiensis TaxID=1190813 RepID=UPI002118E64D|nr:cytochrome bd-I oxidase subunit CydX [Pseudoalteromonas shioyasakiensis]MCQ8877188.1 cytochrome bd-I oxidase subunit CydX [Pseudoalteromonas shioyasakiensis]